MVDCQSIKVRSTATAAAVTMQQEQRQRQQLHHHSLQQQKGVTWFHPFIIEATYKMYQPNYPQRGGLQISDSEVVYGANFRL